MISSDWYDDDGEPDNDFVDDARDLEDDLLHRQGPHVEAGNPWFAGSLGYISYWAAHVSDE